MSTNNIYIIKTIVSVIVYAIFLIIMLLGLVWSLNKD
jgi:hypothetical protein